METRESPHRAVVTTGRLSERQLECLALVAKGYSSKEIARVLDLSPSTVDNHLQAAMQRLGASNRADAVRKLQALDVSKGETEPVAQPWLPPLGGVPNRASTRRRFLYVTQIALLGTMAFAAITITIAGIVGLFSHR